MEQVCSGCIAKRRGNETITKKDKHFLDIKKERNTSIQTKNDRDNRSNSC